jgi:hypothetical protein
MATRATKKSNGPPAFKPPAKKKPALPGPLPPAPVATTSPEEDLFAQLVGTASVKQDKKATRAGITIQLDDESDRTAMNDYCLSKAVADKTGGQLDAARAVLQPRLIERVLGMMLENKGRVDNPEFLSPDGRLVFVVANTVKVQVPTNEDGSPGSLVEYLGSVGLAADRAEAVANLFRQEKTLEMVPLSTLRRREPVVANKLMRLLVGLTQAEANEIALLLVEKGRQPLAEKIKALVGLTPDEGKKVYVAGNEVTPKDNMKPEQVIDELCEMCTTVDELQAAFTACKVEYRITGVKYVGDLAEGAAGLMQRPDEVPEVFTKDKKYKATWSGINATLFVQDGDEYKPLGTKECKDPLHAKNTARKWVTNPAYLAETLAKFGK